MDSDESRTGSSASNSSSTSSSADSNENAEIRSVASSRQSRSKSVNSNSSSSASSSRNNSPDLQAAAALTGPQSQPNENIDLDGRHSIQSTNKIRLNAPNDDANGHHLRSPSHDSNQFDSSNNNSSDGGVDNDDSVKKFRRNSNLPEQQRSIERNHSISPTHQIRSKSSRNSSVSSVASDDDESLKADDISDNDLGNNNDSMQEALNPQAIQQKQDALNMSHEDLSDVSDSDSAFATLANENNNDVNDDDNGIDDNTDTAAERDRSIKAPLIDLRTKLEERINQNQQKSLDVIQCKENDANRTNKKSPSIVDELNDIMDKKHDEDALDFEAEDGECAEEKDERLDQSGEQNESDGEISDGDGLEEGEVSDEDERRPEEIEPKPVCWFYTRGPGQCTWGMSCRFLHPGVTDKGNYTMFDMILPVPIGPFRPGGAAPAYPDYRSQRPLPHIHHPMHPFAAGSNVPLQVRPPIAEPIVESAWERGLRTAKEMMRKANKRKEQDMDFEDKKMNLSAAQDELEKDNNYYIRERSPANVSPPPPFVNHHANMGAAYSHPPKFEPGQRIPPSAAPFDGSPYNRSMRYRELPPHRMPQYENEIIAGKRHIRPAREVIVQRVQPAGRGDEWNDPWMRSKSPGRQREKNQRRNRRSYSSNSSYSNSSNSSTQSGSSSNSNRQQSPTKRRRHYSSTHNSGHKAQDIHNRRHLPGARRSPPMLPKKRQTTPPIPEKQVARPPLISKWKRPSPAPAVPRKPISFSITGNNLRKKKRPSSSGSDSSASDSGSSYSSSSKGSLRKGRTASKRNASRSRDKKFADRKNNSKKAEASAKKRSPPPPAASKSSTDNNNPTSNSNKSNSSSYNSKKTSRREELLKQLRAVEDAIAKKRTKIT